MFTYICGTAAGGRVTPLPSSQSVYEYDVKAMAVIRFLLLLLLSMARLLISAANTSKSILFDMCSLRVTIARHVIHLYRITIVYTSTSGSQEQYTQLD